MTGRNRMTVALGLAAAVLGGCEAPLGAPAADAGDSLAGEWVACFNDGTTDRSRRIVFYPDSFGATNRTFTTTDRTCGGAETGASGEIWRYRLGGQLAAHVGPAGTEVLAREMNLENSYVTLYTIVYVDELATPRQLYFGDLAFDPAQDGTVPEKRPTVLSASPTFTGR